MTKKSAKKRRSNVPKLPTERSNEIYMHRKGASGRRQSIRRMKKIIKQMKADQRRENGATTDTLSSGQEEKDLQLESMDRGEEDSDGVRDGRGEETDNREDSEA